MTPSELITVIFQVGGVIGGAVGLAYYGGQVVRTVRSIDEAIRATNERLEKFADIQQAHGERLASVEARQAAHR